MHSAASLNVHLNCFPIPQRRIPLCFSTSNGFRAPSVLIGVNEANGHRMRNGSGRGKELQGTLRSSARFMTPPRSEEREVQVQMKEAKKADFRSKLSAEQRIGRQQEEPKAKTKKKEKDEFCTHKLALSTQDLHRHQQKEGGTWEEKKEVMKMMMNSSKRFIRSTAHSHLHDGTLKTSQPPQYLPLHLFLPISHTQLSAPSVLVGTPAKPPTPSSSATDSY
ncbi:uncharacterized protein MONOS_6893p2 [Monocercomonoides exilis]|uniref:uncharacterized protein n=1 Tax=Monocercomonoides exilis TaxID=2049356 RepID=UPI00355ACA1E|nr:hypothetical protein MONOS_6893p2 [Monocercomonoides exilis]